jgi:DNA-binding MarR family transcriptional regulator
MTIAPAREEDTTAVVQSVRRILRALRLAAGATQAAGLTAAQLYVLHQLAEADVLSISELAHRTLTDRSSVAAVVDRLVARGLIERSVSPRDRRRAEVRITDAGSALLAHAPPPPTMLLTDALDQLTAAELRTLSRSMVRLVKAMGLEDAAAPMLFEDGDRPA